MLAIEKEEWKRVQMTLPMAGLYFTLMCWSLRTQHLEIMKGLVFGATVPWSSRTCRTTETTAFAENKMFMNTNLRLGFHRVFRLWSCKVPWVFFSLYAIDTSCFWWSRCTLILILSTKYLSSYFLEKYFLYHSTSF